MTSWRRACVAAVVALAACRARYRPPPEAPLDAAPEPAAADAPPDLATPRRADPVATVEALRGVVRWDGARRCAGPAPGGVVAQPVALTCGDRVTTAPDGRAQVQVFHAGSVELAGDVAVEVAGHVGASMVVTRGVVELTSPFDAPTSLRVDTPAGRVIVSVGAARVAVAADGALWVTAREGAVTVWPAPTETGDAGGIRSGSARPLDVGSSLALSPQGATLATVTRATEARALGAMRAWLRRRDGAAVRAGEVARGLARAAAEDEGAVRAALAALDGGAEGRAREDALGALSLALGRLHARARRAEELAPGDAGVGAFEALRDEARRRSR